MLQRQSTALMSVGTSMTNITVIKESDSCSDDELLIQIPDDIIESLGWQEGDSVRWHDNLDGSFTISKVI